MVFLRNLAAGGNFHGKEVNNKTIGEIGYEGCIFFSLVIVAANYVRIPRASKLKKDDFPGKVAKNEDIGL